MCCRLLSVVVCRSSDVSCGFVFNCWVVAVVCCLLCVVLCVVHCMMFHFMLFCDCICVCACWCSVVVPDV